MDTIKKIVLAYSGGLDTSVILYEEGYANNVYALTITRTRSRT